jgi:pimeloyl-ACP methyl ester carboxylesterase
MVLKILTGKSKTLGLLTRVLSMTIITVVILSSCSKDDDGADSNLHLVSKELKLSLPLEFVTGLIAGASDLYPELGSLEKFAKSGVNVYRVVYRTSLSGKPINASGLIIVPSIPGDYPVLCFQNGTNTLNSNAPGNNPAGELYLMVECIASMGYVVVMPDYPGFGASAVEVHPYLIAEPTVTTTVDMLYTLGEFRESGIPGLDIKNEYYLLGYSQGGWATLNLHKTIEQSLSSDFNLKASACGAGPYDLSFLVEEILNADEYPMPVYLGYIINSYVAYGEFTNPVDEILNEPYSSGLSSLYDGTRSSGQINSELTTSIASLVNPGFLSGYASDEKYSSVREALIRNSVSGWKTEIPLLFVHGEADTHVDPGTSDKMYDAMIASGTGTGTCKKLIVPDVGHEEGVLPFAVEAILFLNQHKNN